MPDELPIGLAKQAFNRISKAVKIVERVLQPLPKIERRRYPPSGLGNRVHFVVNHTLDGESAVNATIHDIICGTNPPGLNDDGSIDIFDPALCYFNETQQAGAPDVYAGRHGYADYMCPYGYGYGGINECRWIVSAFCCPPESSYGYGY